MSKFRKNKTSKLFYKSSPYKISTTIKGGHYIKYYGVDIVLHPDFRLPGSYNISLLKSYAKCIKPVLEKDCITRVEGVTTNLFFKEKTDFNFAIEKLNKFITETWEPENDYQKDLLLENKTKVLTDNYPHKIYTHKIILKEMPKDKRLDLYSWMEKYSVNTFRLSPNTKDYLLGKKNWVQNPFILVSDSKLVTMLSLMCNEYVRRIEEFVLRSQINTET